MSTKHVCHQNRVSLKAVFLLLELNSAVYFSHVKSLFLSEIIFLDNFDDIQILLMACSTPYNIGI